MCPSEKGSAPKEKVLLFALLGSKLFPFRVEHFPEGACCTGKQTGSLKGCPLSIKWSIENVSFSLNVKCLCCV